VRSSRLAQAPDRLHPIHDWHVQVHENDVGIDPLAAWVAAGIPRLKMKVGRRPEADLERVRAAREAVGAEAELFVDANSTYDFSV
jgi:L-alanine-DL-glutamate epimerase-like enolase superfamily enzyme